MSEESDRTHLSWSRLAERFWEGDDRALELLLDRERPYLREVLDARAPPRLRARFGLSDLLQQTAIVLATGRERFEDRGPGAFRRLVRTIASRVLRGAIRRENAQKRAADLVMPAMERDACRRSDTTPSARVMLSELLGGMRVCCAKLRADEREIIELVDYRELDLKEVSERLGISHAAARKRHSRAVAHLRELMREAGLLGESRAGR